MLKLPTNSVGDYLKKSRSANTVPGDVPLGGPGNQEAVSTQVWATEPVKPTSLDRIIEYVNSHEETVAGDLVSALGLTIGEVLLALSELKRFGFIEFKQVGEKTVIVRAIGP